MAVTVSEWERVAPFFAEEVERYCVAGSGGELTAAGASTVRTNSELVPKRAGVLLDWLHRLVGRDSLEGLRVLEMGCGFGALACYLALSESASVTAVDIDERMLSVARAALGRSGTAALVELVQADMRDLSQFPDASFDVAILNNSFIYVPTAGEQAAALRELWRTLEPGGTILIFSANKWRWREPFTNDPIVHLLPRRLADRTGWRHNHGRVRLVSPFELKRRLRGAGFHDARMQLQPGRRGLVERNFTHFYGMAARR